MEDEEVQKLRALLAERDKQIHEMKEEMHEFMENSRELERELETEIEQKNLQMNTLTSQVKKLTDDNRQLQERLSSGVGNASSALVELQEEIAALRATEAKLREEKRELEQENDDLQRKAREVEAAKMDATHKLDSTLERAAMVQIDYEELKGQSSELEQRLRDEIRDLQSEVLSIQAKSRANLNNSTNSNNNNNNNNNNNEAEACKYRKFPNNYASPIHGSPMRSLLSKSLDGSVSEESPLAAVHVLLDRVQDLHNRLVTCRTRVGSILETV